MRRGSDAASGLQGTLLLLLVIVVVIVVARLTGLTQVLTIDEAERLRATILAYGWMGPVLVVGVYIIAGLAFVPGFVLTVLTGLIFGPWRGLVYASLGSTLAACVAFLIARYAARGPVEAWVSKRPALRRLDVGVIRHGFRIVMFTRLVPVLPFGVLNYAFGVTGIGFGTFAVTSWACMLPATAALTFAAGTIAERGWRSSPPLMWLVVTGLLVVSLTLVRVWARRSATLRKIRESSTPRP